MQVVVNNAAAVRGDAWIRADAHATTHATVARINNSLLEALFLIFYIFLLNDLHFIGSPMKCKWSFVVLFFFFSQSYLLGQKKLMKFIWQAELC